MEEENAEIRCRVAKMKLIGNIKEMFKYKEILHNKNYYFCIYIEIHFKFSLVERYFEHYIKVRFVRTSTIKTSNCPFIIITVSREHYYHHTFLLNNKCVS